MIEAPHYLIFLSEEKDHYIENAGYRAQDIMPVSYTHLGIKVIYYVILFFLAADKLVA